MKNMDKFVFICFSKMENLYRCMYLSTTPHIQDLYMYYVLMRILISKSVRDHVSIFRIKYMNVIHIKPFTGISLLLFLHIIIISGHWPNGL